MTHEVRRPTNELPRFHGRVHPLKPNPVVVRINLPQTEKVLVHRLLFFSALTTWAHATVTQPPIVVTAKRPEFSRPAPSAKVTTFSQDRIKKNQYTQVVDILNATPGYTVVQSGGIGQQSSIFVRGTNSNHIQVRLDGMRVNSPQTENGSFDAALMTTQNINSVMLLRGGQSSLYGTDAIGGVILLTTRKGDGDFKETIRLEGGSQKTVNAYGHLAGGFNNSGLYIGVSRFLTAGIHQTPTEYRSPDGSYPRLPYRQCNYALRLDHRPNEGTELSLISRLTSGRLSYQLPDRAISQQRQQSLQRVLITLKPTSFWHHHLGIGYLSLMQHNARREPTFTKSQGYRQQADWTQVLELQKYGSISITTEASKDTAIYYDMMTSASHHQHASAIGALWQKKWDWGGLDFSARHDKTSRFHHSNTHREGLVLTPFKSTKLLFSHATSFKTPTLYQLYAKTPYFSGNPHLKPEKAHQWEVGFEQRLFGKFLWEETYFINHLHSLIQASPDWKSVINIGRARTSGLESVLTWVGYKGWSADINHTYTKAYNLMTSQRLLRRPITKLSGRLHYTCETWLWTLEMARLGRRSDIDPLVYQRITAKPYTLVNLKVQKKHPNALTTFGRIENLFNRRIQEPIGYRKAGISIFIGLEKSFG